MPASPHRVLRFDIFTLDLTRRIVLRGDQQLTLRRQSFDVLLYLAEHAGVLISKDDLRQAVWPTTEVTPGFGLAVHQRHSPDAGRGGALDHQDRLRARIHLHGGGRLRRARAFSSRSIPEPRSAVQAGLDTSSNTNLDTKESGGDPEEPTRCRTVPPAATHDGRGRNADRRSCRWWLARLAAGTPRASGNAHHDGGTLDCGAPVRGIEQPAGRGQRGPRSVRRRHHRDVAALAPRPHDLASVLGRLPRRDGRLRALGRQLDARYLAQGSFRREGDMLHVNVRLIEAETGRQLSAESFEYALEARKYAVVTIARAIGLEMLSAEATPASRAVHRRATMSFWPSPSWPLRAMPRLTLRLLPFLKKHWSSTRTGFRHWFATRERTSTVFKVAGRLENEHAARLGKAEAAVERAIQRAPRHFLTHYVRGMLLESKGDRDGAIAAMEYVLALNPHLAEAHARLGRAKIDAGLAHEAVAHIEEAIRLGPAARGLFSWYFWAGQAAIHVGDYSAAFQWLQKARQANPGYVQVLPWLAMAYAGLGRERRGPRSDARVSPEPDQI